MRLELAFISQNVGNFAIQLGVNALRSLPGTKLLISIQQILLAILLNFLYVALF